MSFGKYSHINTKYSKNDSFSKMAKTGRYTKAIALAKGSLWVPN